MSMHVGLGRKLRFTRNWLRGLRAYDPQRRRIRLNGPSTVQLQTIDRCNAACIMCPYSAVEKPGPARVMEDALYRHILEGIRKAGAISRVLLMLQNEPMLDRQFADRVRLAKQILGPGSRVSTVTNGSPLTPANIEALDACGIDHVSVSIDAATGETFAKVRRGLSFPRVVEQTLALVRRLGPARVGVKFLRQVENAGEEKQVIAFWRRHGVPVTVTEPTNRAGSLSAYDNVRTPHPTLLKSLAYPILNRLVPVCPLPFSSMNILWDGHTILCCHDWGPRDYTGDLSRESFQEAWNGEKANHYRHLLWTRQTGESAVCSDCSLAGEFYKV